MHIQPGKPTQNAHVESFHGRLREECLAVSWFQNLFDARRKIAAWRKEYDENVRTAAWDIRHRRSLPLRLRASTGWSGARDLKRRPLAPAPIPVKPEMDQKKFVVVSSVRNQGAGQKGTPSGSYWKYTDWIPQQWAHP